MAVRAQAQTSLYEAMIDDQEVEDALEEREGVKIELGEKRKAFKEVDERAKGLLGALDLGDEAPVRIGRFVVTRRQVPARAVAFETSPSVRLRIRTLPVDEEE